MGPGELPLAPDISGPQGNNAVVGLGVSTCGQHILHKTSDLAACFTIVLTSSLSEYFAIMQSPDR